MEFYNIDFWVKNLYQPAYSWPSFCVSLICMEMSTCKEIWSAKCPESKVNWESLLREESVQCPIQQFYQEEGELAKYLVTQCNGSHSFAMQKRMVLHFRPFFGRLYYWPVPKTFNFCQSRTFWMSFLGLSCIGKYMKTIKTVDMVFPYILPFTFSSYKISLGWMLA